MNWLYYFCSKKPTVIDDLLNYDTSKDGIRVAQIKSICDITQEYFIPYNDELYRTNKSILHYRMEEYKSFIREHTSNKIYPVFLNQIHRFQTLRELSYCLDTLSDINIDILHTILKEYKERKERQLNNTKNI